MKIRSVNSRAVSITNILSHASAAAFFIYTYTVSLTPVFSPDSGSFIQYGQIIPVDGPGSIRLGLDSNQIEGFNRFSLIGDSTRGWPAIAFFMLDNLLFQGTYALPNILSFISVFLSLFLITRWLEKHIGMLSIPVSLPVLFLVSDSTAINHFLHIGAESVLAFLLFPAVALTLIETTRDPVRSPIGLIARGSIAISLAGLASMIRVPFLMVFFAIVATFVTLAWSKFQRRSAQVGSLATLGGFSSVLLIWTVFLQNRQSAAWGSSSEYSMRFFYRLSNGQNGEYAGLFRKNLPPEAPQCAIDFPASVSGWGEIYSWIESRCSSADQDWIAENFVSSLAYVFLTHPHAFFEWLWSRFARFSQPWAADESLIPTSFLDTLREFLQSKLPLNEAHLVLVLALSSCLFLGVALIHTLTIKESPARALLSPATPYILLLLIACLATLAVILLDVSQEPRKGWPVYHLFVGVTGYQIAYLLKGQISWSSSSSKIQ